MMNRAKKYIDDHMLEITGGAIAAGLAVGVIGIASMAARIGAQEGFKQGIRAFQNRPVQLLINEEGQIHLASEILKGVKLIKQAEKAAKVATEIVR